MPRMAPISRVDKRSRHARKRKYSGGAGLRTGQTDEEDKPERERTLVETADQTEQTKEADKPETESNNIEKEKIATAP